MVRLALDCEELSGWLQCAFEISRIKTYLDMEGNSGERILCVTFVDNSKNTEKGGTVVLLLKSCLWRCPSWCVMFSDNWYEVLCLFGEWVVVMRQWWSKGSETGETTLDHWERFLVGLRAIYIPLQSETVFLLDCDSYHWKVRPFSSWMASHIIVHFSCEQRKDEDDSFISLCVWYW